MRHWVWPIVMGAALGCAPKGKPPAVPVSLQLGADGRAVGGQEEKPVVLAEEPLRHGLPTFCEARQAEELSCIVCRVQEMPVERCFGRNADFEPKKICTYDKHQLKCLVTDSLLVVKIPFQNSPEKQVLDNLPVIIASIKTIVENSESPQQDEVVLLFGLLDFVQTNSRAILMGQQPAELARQLSRELATDGKTMDAKVVQALEEGFVSGVLKLREQAVQGRLDDADGLGFMRELALLFVQNEKTVHMLKTMNVDGLASISG